jgi:hypothetical protein
VTALEQSHVVAEDAISGWPMGLAELAHAAELGYLEGTSNEVPESH